MKPRGNFSDMVIRLWASVLRSIQRRRHPLLDCLPLFIAVMVCFGCAPSKNVVAPDQAINDKPLPVWPSPPDLPRFSFETVLRSAADIHIENEDEKLRSLLTGRKSVSSEPAFMKPGAVVARGGRVYVADTISGTIVVFDASRKRVFSFGQRQQGDIATPSGLALDKNGMVYVADSKNRTVMVFDHLGLYQRSIGDKTLLLRPTGVAVDSERNLIYVVDRGDNDSDVQRLLAFHNDGSIAWQVGTRGSGPGQFNAPIQVAISADGTVHVLDSGNFRVQSFSPEGKFIRTFGSVGLSLGNFSRPRGLATDKEGRIYVTDAGFSNLQIFTPDGSLLLVIGRASKEDRPGEYGLLSGVAVDETGRIYLVDQMFRKVEVIRPSGK